MIRRLSGRVIYFGVAGLLLTTYAVAALLLHGSRDWSDHGPLAYTQPAASSAFPGAPSLSQALDDCFRPSDRSADDQYKVVGGMVNGNPYYACYEVSAGTILRGKVIGSDGAEVSSPAVIKAGGAWPWLGVVKSGSDLVLGGAGMAAILGFGWLYYRRARPAAVPSPRWYQQSAAVWSVTTLLPLVGWVALALWPGVPPARKVRVAMQAVLFYAGFMIFVLITLAAGVNDSWAYWVIAFLTAGFLWSLIGGRRLLAPVSFGAMAAETALVPSTPAALTTAGTRAPSTLSMSSPSQQSAQASDEPPLGLRVERPGTLPSFRDVGGMTRLKEELKDTIGLLLAYPEKANAYRIRWTGVLLHGPPGVGKTFVARATAGEFGLNFLPVPASSIVSSFRGESAKNVADAFKTALANIPCILFFDEFDAIAERREDFPDQESRRTVDQLLQSLEQNRGTRELIVMAATNNVTTLDPAVIRPGRFDRHIRVDLPDQAARVAIFGVSLGNRPLDSGVDLTDLGLRAEGRTAAGITKAVESAALSAFKRASEAGEIVEITQADLVTALEKSGGKDRPTVQEWSWDQLVLPANIKSELQELVAVIRNPLRAKAYGVEPPSGLLLTGPPGTGKTTIAKVIAAQAYCSFYPISATDVTSKWVGESEQNIARLFERARENQPSIIFIDEIDAIAGKRGGVAGWDRQVNQLLKEIDGMSGQKGVFTMGATNLPDTLDPALLRGGRLSRTIDIPLPDRDDRLALLKLFTDRMPVPDVDLGALAKRTDKLSGADLRALCQQAALLALVRQSGTEGAEPGVTSTDFDAALEQRSKGPREIGFKTGGGPS
jgi:SpoVK/Ycf46/Vps4 family AAA+-type ATPase